MRNTSPLCSPKNLSGDDWSGNDGSATSSRYKLKYKLVNVAGFN
jgi:hypothetical protein